MKHILQIAVFLAAFATAHVANAEPVRVDLLQSGYAVSGKLVTTLEQVEEELQAQDAKEVLVPMESNASMERLGSLINIFQKSGMRVGFFTAPIE